MCPVQHEGEAAQGALGRHTELGHSETARVVGPEHLRRKQPSQEWKEPCGRRQEGSWCLCVAGHGRNVKDKEHAAGGFGQSTEAQQQRDLSVHEQCTDFWRRKPWLHFGFRVLRRSSSESHWVVLDSNLCHDFHGSVAFKLGNNSSNNAANYNSSQAAST